MSAELPLEPETVPNFTTRDVERALAAKFGERQEYLVVFNVQEHVGVRGRQYADCIAVANWGSGNGKIQGFEIKASRSDWLRELKKVEKADAFINRCDHWWLVTADKSITKIDEIPACWGWMNLTKSGLRIEKPAPKLPDRDVNLPFLIAVMRRCYERSSEDRTIEDRIAKVREDCDERIRNAEKAAKMAVSYDYKQLRDRVDKFEKASGINLDDWRFGRAGEAVLALCEMIGYNGDAPAQLEMHAKSIAKLADQMREVAQAVAQLRVAK